MEDEDISNPVVRIRGDGIMPRRLQILVRKWKNLFLREMQIYECDFRLKIMLTPTVEYLKKYFYNLMQTRAKSHGFPLFIRVTRSTLKFWLENQLFFVKILVCEKYLFFQELFNLLKINTYLFGNAIVVIVVNKDITYINVEDTVIQKFRPLFWTSSVTKNLNAKVFKLLLLHMNQKVNANED